MFLFYTGFFYFLFKKIKDMLARGITQMQNIFFSQWKCFLSYLLLNMVVIYYCFYIFQSFFITLFTYCRMRTLCSLLLVSFDRLHLWSCCQHIPSKLCHSNFCLPKLTRSLNKNVGNSYFSCCLLKNAQELTLVSIFCWIQKVVYDFILIHLSAEDYELNDSKEIPNNFITSLISTIFE